jgi:acetate kinase
MDGFVKRGFSKLAPSAWLPGGEVTHELPRGEHKEAFAAMAEALASESAGVVDTSEAITAVGHRVVHGGDRFTNSVIITDEVVKQIEEISELAPYPPFPGTCRSALWSRISTYR